MALAGEIWIIKDYLSQIYYPYSVSSNRLRAGGAIRGRSVTHMDVQTVYSLEGVREAEEVPGNDRVRDQRNGDPIMQGRHEPTPTRKVEKQQTECIHLN